MKVTAEQRRRILARDGHQCLRCEGTQHLTIDHIMPRHHNGPPHDDNLQTLCRSCNSSKGTRTRDFRTTE
jgi:5-methylcytosine-specific restriction endonuclease McrA